ncbi:TROVE domain-containing protein [Pseudodesulfovibrio sediminis]|uniref:Ribonucleoprotein n=1 Tax=Pseudodesulfovibrio sediminis TaxID=2810563 RepID=A0ABM8HY70_9BACT|nr:TROVE domain-containing protein [Pseudodesulfovibrio sediminis]BCS88989.1 ribonucleoprotein [Pseudodesulfovibrio sediminis]
MANTELFKTIAGKFVPPTTGTNNAGAAAYTFDPKHTLAQYVATGTLGGTFYASARDELDSVLELVKEVEPEFVAKAAIYSREKGFMKDMPALLCAWLSVTAPGLLPVVFERVIDNGRMLRNFVQIMRSGVVGRKSLGSRPKRLVRNWLADHSEDTLLRASVGNSPSLADIIKMVHPKPEDEVRDAFYGWLIGRDVDRDKLPALVRDYEDYKETGQGRPPAVSFQMLASLDIGKEEWTEIARNAGWTMTRMNLNTFARHGVFENPEMVAMVAKRLADQDELRKARVFPYQVLSACVACGDELPGEIREALQDALEYSLEAVPALGGKVYVCPDVSGSMGMPVTGYRAGATSAVTCVDVAGLVAAAVLRKNPEAEILAFDYDVVPLQINARDSVLTNAGKFGAVWGGGTNISAPLESLNSRRAKGDMVILVSDNESWVDADSAHGTELMRQWSLFKRRNPQARLVCMDIAPYNTTQATERDDIMNVGGFSDTVFNLIDIYARGLLNEEHWVGVIEGVEL